MDEIGSEIVREPTGFTLSSGSTIRAAEDSVISPLESRLSSEIRLSLKTDSASSTYSEVEIASEPGFIVTLAPFKEDSSR